MRQTTLEDLEAWSAFERPEQEHIDEWAERVIVLPRSVSSVPGPLSLDWCPFLRKPLRDATDPNVEEITLCFSTQVGKTLAGMLIILHAAAQLKRPALQVLPTEAAAVGICTERYQPIIEASPELARLLDPGRKKEMTRSAIRLGGIWIHFVGARSPTELSSRAKGIICLDETDKYDTWTGREADPIELAQERAATFLDRVVLKTSTPTTDRQYIWPELLASTNERYHVPCPRCGEYQELVMGNGAEGSPGIKWPSGADPEDIVDRRLAWYECEHCHGRIEEYERDGMVREGVWVPSGQSVEGGKLVGDAPSRRRAGYHLWAAYSPWQTFGEIARKFLQCYSNGRAVPSKLMNFRNSKQAKPWQETAQELREDRLRECQGGYPQGVLPDDTRVIVITADVQSERGLTYLYHVVRAWGDRGKSWLIAFGRLDGWEALAEVLRGVYSTTSGRDLRPRFAMIDSGYRTDEVYQFCLKTGAWAIRGTATLKAQQSVGLEECAGESIQRLAINVDYYKDKLHRLIREREGWQLPMDLPREYFDHMVAEQKVQEVERSTGRVKFKWRCVPEGAPNHAMDCEVYQIAACELLQLETQATPVAATEGAAPAVKKEDVF